MIDIPVTAPFTILVDSRERARYFFSGIRTDASDGGRPLIVPTEWASLKTGDYSIRSMESLVCVERKSLEDLYSTLGSGREQFQREHERMAEMDFACVVIEASWATIIQRPPERSKLNPKTVFRTAVSWQQRYGVPWMPMEDRRLAELTTFRILERYWERHHE